MHPWMIDGWPDRWMAGRTDGWMDGRLVWYSDLFIRMHQLQSHPSISTDDKTLKQPNIFHQCFPLGKNK